MISSKKLRSKTQRRRQSLKSRQQFNRRLERLESRQLLASLAGEVWADSNADGIRDIGEEPAANVRVYIDANDDGQLNGQEVFTSTNELGEYVFNQIDAGTHVVRMDLRFGQDQSSPQAYFGTGYFGPDLGTPTTPTQLFEMSAAGVVRPIGTPTTARIHGLTRVNSGEFFGVNFLNDSIYRVDAYTGVDTLLQAPGPQLTPGLAYDATTDTLYTVGKSGTATTLFQLYEIDQDDGSVTPIGPGLTGFQNISDLTFDTANDRIVGFDNGSNKFFAFDTNGNGQFLADSSRDLDSWSLAYNGSTFVMFDRADPDKTDLLQVDPDTGVIAPLLDASMATPAESLVYPVQGDVAHRVTVQTVGAESGLDFGVIGEPIQPTRGGTLFINEILSDGLFGGNEDSYLEIRGEKNGVIPDGTYLAIINERGASGSASAAGTINGIFDLSNLTLGANGFLVILPQGSPHQPNVNSSVLQSSTADFGGLPGGIYSDVAPDFGSFTSVFNGNGYLLFQSNVRPNLFDDIDANDDGLIDPDGVAGQWDILDSISHHSFVSQANFAYGKIAFIEEGANIPTVQSAPDVEFVITEGHGYLGRIGDSIGSTSEDWVGGTVRDERTSPPVQYGLESGILGIPLPMAFMGRDLDHVGESNFVGGVRGTVALQPLTPDQTFVDPAEGVVVLADTNRNGRQDVLSFSIDPDQYPLQTDFINLLDGVTLNSARGDNTIVGFPIRSVAESPFISGGNKIFSQAGVGFFPDSTRFRADFYRPARSVSIVGISAGSETYIRLDAYDANDNLIGSTTSNALFGSDRQRLTVSFTDDAIAYAVAYSADDVESANGTIISSSPFGKLDSFSYTQSEATAVSDEFGFYEITNLFPDEYQITFLNTETNRGLTGAQAVPIEITRYENFVLSPNLEPAVEDLAVVVDENTPAGTSLGALAGSDDGPVTFNIVDGAETGLLIDPASGELIVGPNAVLDFEATPTFNVFVGVTDELGATVIAVVTVELRDVNETPIIQPTFLSLPEDTPSQTAIGQIRAVDPDFVQNQTLTYTLIGGTGAGAFSVDPARGIVTLEDASLVDFEENSQLTLRVRVTDNGTPQESVTFDQVILVNDTNDKPQLIAADFSVAENSTGVVETISVIDADPGQLHTFQIDGGSGAGLFTLDQNGDLRVREGVTLDFEQNSEYTLELSVLDNGAPLMADTATINVTITDVNEPAVLVSNTASVGENAAADTVVATLELSDPEGFPEHYAIALLTTGDSENFVLDPLTLELKVSPNAQFDFETQQANELTFEIVDLTGESETDRVDFRVDILNENDPPEVLTTRITVSELAAEGDILGQIRFTDTDFGETFSAEIVGGTGAPFFQIDPDTHFITLREGAELDADAGSNVLTLEIVVTDSGGLTGSGIVDVRLNNVNEPPVIKDDLEVPAATSGQQFVFTLPQDWVVDPEGAEFQISIFTQDANGNPAGLPRWLSFNQSTRTLSGLPDPSFLGGTTLTLRAFEFGSLNLFSTANFTINVQAGSAPLSNTVNPSDVDNNQRVTPNDILAVSRFLDAFGVRSADNVDQFFGFVDVNQDGLVTPADILLVINELLIQAFSQLQAEAIDYIDSGDDLDDAIDAAFADLGQSSLF